MENFTIEFEADSEGYFSYECPFCEEQFKLLAHEVQENETGIEELSCPYCGLVDEASNFYTKEIVAYIHDVVKEWAIDTINKEFGSIKSSKNIKVDFKKIKHTPMVRLAELDTVEEVFACPACDRHEKVLYNVGASNIFCAYCGSDIQ